MRVAATRQIMAGVLWCVSAAAALAAPAPTKQTDPAVTPMALAAVASGDTVSMNVDQVSYAVEEPIRFSVESSRPAFVYVYAIDSETGHAYMLEPAFDRPALRVTPGMAFDLPPEGVEFYADKPGVERVVLVASQNEIDLALLTAAALDESGALPLPALERLFSRHGANVGQPGLQQGDGGWFEVRHIDITVTDAAAGSSN